jgi:hypothetical protein
MYNLSTNSNTNNNTNSNTNSNTTSKLNRSTISYESRNDVTIAILLLTLSLAGNYISQSLGCQTQNLFTNNIYVKHLLIFFVIYFSIDFTSKNNVNVNPMINIIRAFLIWILFHLYSRMDIIPTLVVLVLLIISYIINKYKEYYASKIDGLPENEKNDNNELINNLNNYTIIISILSVIITIIGFFLYYHQKKKDFKGKFSLIKFIFGIKKCKSI